MAHNESIRTVQCDIRREVEISDRVMTTLSRVWFARGDRLCVETVIPVPRRIVVDGNAIHKWIEGQPQGIRLPIAEAPTAELLQVRRVPATGEEYLLRLRGVDETVLPPTEGFPVRRAYTPDTPHPYTVVALDKKGRLARIEFFDPADHGQRLSRVDFRGWKEVLPGHWIACSQTTETEARDGIATFETLRVSGLKVNQPIAPEPFDAARQAPAIEFIPPAEMLEKLQRDPK
ncbi:MAG: hypothetical protein HN919_12875 [Verrucomicrobia bacterium]|nr:hypothetical protein [Verrucomicrobiota bacterium]